MSRQKQVKELIHAAKAQGWEVEVDGSGHYRLTPPGDTVSLSISSTPSDYRTLKNEAAKLKRMGLRLPGQSEAATVQCGASWHGERDNPVGFCGHCRGKWKFWDLEPDPVEEFVTANFVPPDEWFLPKTDEEEVTVEIDEGSIRSRVLKALTDLSGEYLATSEVASLVELPREQVGSALRSLHGVGSIERSKRGRYGVARRPKPTEPITEPEPTVQKEPEATTADVTQPEPPPAPRGVTVDVAPPDVNKAWSWVPGTGWVEGIETHRPADAPPLYEGTGLRDSKGRPVIKDEGGDLFVAVPLVLSV